MKQSITKILALCFCQLFLISCGCVFADQQSTNVYPTAILSFHERGDEVQGMGAKVADLLMVSLIENPNLYLLDRGDMSKILEEAEINISGMVNPNQVNQLGQLSGAQIFVTGSVMAIGDKIILMAKIIGTETSRVLGASVKGTADIDLDILTEQLGNKINSLISSKGSQIVAKKASQKDVVSRIKSKITGDKRPTLYIKITERHIGRSTIDPAAETEFIKICQEVGFQVLNNDKSNVKKNADIVIQGEGFSEYATRRKNLISCKARIEIKAVEQGSGKLILTDRQTAISVDLGEMIAAKTALQNAAEQLAERVLPKISK